MFPWIAVGAAALTALFVAGCSHDSSEKHVQEPESSEPPPKTNSVQVPVPESSHTSSGDVDWHSPCPPDMTAVDKFCVDRYEASLWQGSQAHPHNLRPQSISELSAVSVSGVYPQAYISREEAALACRNSAKRLCSLSEWLQACRGSAKFVYPYGNVEDRKKCNNWKPHLLLKVFRGVPPMAWQYDKHFNNPVLNAIPNFLAKTGEYLACISASGALDMVGNLHEWVSDTVDFDLKSKISLNKSLDRKLKDNWGHGIFMGGFYSTTNEHGLGCQFITIGHEPDYHDYSTGFRCCADAKIKSE